MEENEYAEALTRQESQNSAFIDCPFAGIITPGATIPVAHRPGESYLLEYVLEGNAFAEISGGTVVIPAGHIACIPKEADLVSYGEEGAHCRKISVHLTGEMVDKLFALFEIHGLWVTPCRVPELFWEILDLAETLASENAPHARGRILELAFLLLSDATGEHFFPSRPTKSSLAEKIRDYMEGNLYTNLSLDRITSHFGFTKMHVIRVFKQAYGQTPMQYLLARKISIGKSLLKDTVMPIREIASLLRYSNTQHFSAAFKKAVGQTPHEFRRNENR